MVLVYWDPGSLANEFFALTHIFIVIAGAPDMRGAENFFRRRCRVFRANSDFIYMALDDGSRTS
jgi:hypothetical protein